MKKILIGISASIAAYKANELVRALYHKDYSVQVILTPNALNFVSPLTLESLSGNPVYREEFSDRDTSALSMPHIELRKDLDVFALVPATANTIGKLANGIADNLLTSTYFALEDKTKVLIAPAMNPFMFKHPAVQENLKRLQSFGAALVLPGTGEALCGDEGSGKLAPLEQIIQSIEELLK